MSNGWATLRITLYFAPALQLRLENPLKVAFGSLVWFEGARGAFPCQWRSEGKGLFPFVPWNNRVWNIHHLSCVQHAASDTTQQSQSVVRRTFCRGWNSIAFSIVTNTGSKENYKGVHISFLYMQRHHDGFLASTHWRVHDRALTCCVLSARDRMASQEPYLFNIK